MERAHIVQNRRFLPASPLFTTYLKAHPDDKQVIALQLCLGSHQEIPGVMLVKTQDRSHSFIQHPVAPDGDCGYTAFGITRDQAHELLTTHKDSIQSFLHPLIADSLLDETFINYIRNRTTDANIDLDYLNFEKLFEDFKTHQTVIQVAEEAVPVDAPSLQDLKSHADSQHVIQAYLDYSVRDKKTFSGWPHPAELQALAHIQRIELYIWRLDNGSLVPYSIGQGVDSALNIGSYAHFCPTHTDDELGKTFQRTDLVYLEGNHFNRLELIKEHTDEKALAALFNFLITIINDEKNPELLIPRLQLLSDILRASGLSISELLSESNKESLSDSGSATPTWDSVKQKLRILIPDNNQLLNLPITTEILFSETNIQANEQDYTGTLLIYLNQLLDKQACQIDIIDTFLEWISIIPIDHIQLIDTVINNIKPDSSAKNTLILLVKLHSAALEQRVGLFETFCNDHLLIQYCKNSKKTAGLYFQSWLNTLNNAQKEQLQSTLKIPFNFQLTNNDNLDFFKDFFVNNVGMFLQNSDSNDKANEFLDIFTNLLNIISTHKNPLSYLYNTISESVMLRNKKIILSSIAQLKESGNFEKLSAEDQINTNILLHGLDHENNSSLFSNLSSSHDEKYFPFVLQVSKALTNPGDSSILKFIITQVPNLEEILRMASSLIPLKRFLISDARLNVDDVTFHVYLGLIICRVFKKDLVHLYGAINISRNQWERIRTDYLDLIRNKTFQDRCIEFMMIDEEHPLNVPMLNEIFQNDKDQCFNLLETIIQSSKTLDSQTGERILNQSIKTKIEEFYNALPENNKAQVQEKARYAQLLKAHKILSEPEPVASQPPTHTPLGTNPSRFNFGNPRMQATAELVQKLFKKNSKT
ncbi:MAG: hypothetical protein JSS53_07925 [Proteobacteria bacterium]|nr:hypothetical protein [Pseudomonadota bacterium]